MDKTELLALYDREMRINAPPEPTFQNQILPHLIRTVSHNKERRSWIAYSNLQGLDIDAAIRDEVTYFNSIGRTVEWVVYEHDYPPDLKERLTGYGFEIEEAEAVMVLDLETLPERLKQAHNHDIRKITDPELIEEALSVQTIVWEHDYSDLLGVLRYEMSEDPDYLSIYVAYDGDKPVSSAWIKYPEGSRFGLLFGGSTLEAYRGQGIYTTLLATRVQDALQHGRRFLTVDASDMSRPILEKLGFKLVSIAYPCAKKPDPPENV